MSVWLDGQKYELVADSTMPSGRRSFASVVRPSDPTADPGRIRKVIWKISGPIGQSREGANGILAVDYTDNVEHRYGDLLTSIAARNALTLTGLDPTGTGLSFGDAFGSGVFGPTYVASDVDFIEEDRGQLFFHRNYASTQVDPAGPTVVQTAIHQQPVKGAAVWKNKGRIGLGHGATMQTRVTVNSTTSTYEDTKVNGVGMKAGPLTVGSDRLWIVDASEVDSNRVRFTLDDFDSISNVFAVGDDKIPATGIGTLAHLTAVGSEVGASSFTDAGKAVRLLEALKGHRSANNGKSMASLWGWLYITTDLGLYAWEGGLVVNPVGLESLEDFEGPIDGVPQVVFPWRDSIFCAYETTAGHAYVIRGRFGRETAATGRPDWFAFRRLASTQVKAIFATSQRTNPTILLGEDSNSSYYTMGARGRDIADGNYVFSVDGGQWFGSTMTRTAGLHCNLRQAEFLTENCTDTNTWQLAVSPDEGTYVNVGAAVSTDGHHVIRPSTGGVAQDNVSFHTLKPRLTQVAASTTAPPQIRGFLTVLYDERPDVITESVVVLNIGQMAASARFEINRLNDLADHETTSPITMRMPEDDEDTYGFVTGVEVQDLKGDGNMSATVTIQQWKT